jgi:hypothetical protein
MQQTDRDRRSLDACPPSFLRAIHHTAHVPHREPHGPVHSVGDLAETRLTSWESAWIDLGGEG